MGVCAVFDCKSSNENNNNETTSFHTFPKEKLILKQWTKFCKRKDKFNTNTSRICSLHFEIDSFGNNMEYEMG